jgi:hypothetical protein
MIKGLSASGALPVQGPSPPEKTRGPADGGGKHRRKNAAYTRLQQNKELIGKTAIQLLT